jgi:hypothetical protein
MQWNCPHCQTAISTDDAQIATGWNFTQCCRCNGHSLVRRAEVNLVRLDKEPQGEKILKAQEARVTPPPFPGVNLERPQQLNPALEIFPAANTTPTQTAPASGPRRGANPSHWMLAAAAMLALGSGISLYRQGSRLLQQVEPTTELASITASASTTDPAPGIFAKLENKPALLSDSVTTRSMAPQRETTSPGTPQATLQTTVQVQVKNAILRAGPGQEHAKISMASLADSFTVAEWKDRWFKIVLPATGGTPTRTAWVRNDLVKLINP